MIVQHSNAHELFTTTYGFYYVASSYVENIMLGTTHCMRPSHNCEMSVVVDFCRRHARHQSNCW